jgi:hypothetical protein
LSARPAALVLEALDSLHFLFGFVAHHTDLSIDLLPCARGSTTSSLVSPNRFHHFPKTIRLNRSCDRLDSHLDRSRGKVDFLSQLKRSVRLHSTFNDDSRGIHDIPLTSSRAYPGYL